MNTPDTLSTPMSVYDLLMQGPDDQVMRLRFAWQASVAGQWSEAAYYLRNAARECAGTAWGDDCATLAAALDQKTKREHI